MKLMILSFAFLISILIHPVKAHSWYDLDCCSGDDCDMIPAETVTEHKDYYEVILNKGDHKLVNETTRYIFQKGNPRIRTSKDFQNHMCINKYDVTIGLCLYVAPGSM